MAQVKFYRGPRASYVSSTHADGIYFATDTLEIVLNNEAYSLSKVVRNGLINGASYDAAAGKVTFTKVDGSSAEFTIPAASGTVPGLMSAADKAKFDALVADSGDGSITDQIAAALEDAKEYTDGIKTAIDAYTVNGKAISTNPTLVGSDIQVTGYTKPSGETTAIEATDTVNAALGKLENANTNTQDALEAFIGTKNQPNGIAGLDEDGKIPSTLLNGQLASVQGVDAVTQSTSLPSGQQAGYMVWCTDDSKFREFNGTSWDVIDPKGDTIYNFRNSDATGSTGRTNILYRWDGAHLVEISESIALGETTGTAYEGSKGKANRDALNSAPTTVVTGFGVVTPNADNLTIAFTNSNKNGGNNQYSAGDGGDITIPVATDTEAGLMAPADKEYLEAVKGVIGEDTSDLDLLTRDNAGIGVLADYTIAADAAAVAPTDTINQAIGKLEKSINNIAGDGEGSIAEQIQTAIDNLKGDAAEGYDTLGELEDAIQAVDAKVGVPGNGSDVPATGLFLEIDNLEARVKANEDAIAIINGVETVEGSIKKAAADTLAAAKEYTDGALEWVVVN